MPEPARTRLTHGERRGLILDAAARVIASRGLHAFRLQDVADEAGVSQALVSTHFKSRDDLVIQTFERADAQALDGAAGILDGTAARPNGSVLPDDLVGVPDSGLARIREFLHRATIEETREEGHEGRELWHQVFAQARFSPAIRASVRTRQTAWTDRLADYVRAAQADGSVTATIDPDRTALLLVTVLDGLTPSLRCDLIDVDQARGVVDDAIHGILEP